MSFYLFILLTFILLGRPQDFFSPLASLRPGLVLTIITLIMSFLENKQITPDLIFKSKESKKYALFYLIMILGIPFAVHRRVAFDFTILLYLSNILFFYFCLIHIDSVKKLKGFIFVICFSLFFFSAMSLISGAFRDERFRVKGLFDSNDLAFVLVSLFPLSIYYIMQNEGLFKRVFGLTTIGMSVITILLTGSRGGFLGLLVVFALLFFKHSRRINVSTKILILIIAFAVTATYGHRIDTERYRSLTEVSSDYNVTSEQGRWGIWKKGLQLILSNPITGVGVNCFPNAIGDLRAELGELPKWQAVHNSYLQVAAEMGLIGFFFFYSMIAGALKNLSNGTKNEIASPYAQDVQSITASIQLGFIGSLVVAFFLSQAYSIVFTLFFALSAVIRNLSVMHTKENKLTA